MYHYEYVNKKDAEPYRNEFEEIIHEVQDLLRDKFTFRYDYIGSSSRNMITFDPTTNRGFDFDVNIHVNDDEEKYSAEDIKLLLMSRIDQVARRRGFDPCKNHTRVITLKKTKAFPYPKIEYSCDFAIVYDYMDDNGRKHQQYIQYQKGKSRYFWSEQPKGYDLEAKADWIKDHGLWNDVRELYLYKKNNNIQPDKKSRALYAETIHEICQQNGYYRHN